MTAKILEHSLTIFCAVFVFVFSWLAGHIMFANHYGLSPVLLPFMTFVFALPLIIGVWIALGLGLGSGKVSISREQGRLVLFVFMAVTFVLLIAIGYRLRFTPVWDVDALFTGGALWAETGTLVNPSKHGGTYDGYFAMFANQLGGVFLFRCLFAVYGLFGGSDYHIAALVYNVIMLEIMVLALYDAAKRLGGVRAGVYALFLLGIFIPFYTMGAVYYTDVLTMPFVVIAFALYLRGREASLLRNKTALFAACALAATLGAVIKFTVMIVLIAVFIDYIIYNKDKWRVRLICCGAAALVVVVTLTAFHGYIGTQLSPELVDQRRIPTTHWVMMGLQGEGAYDPGDYEFTKNLPDLATRQRETARVALQRVGELGPAGMYRLIRAKSLCNFSDGNYGMAGFLGTEPVFQTWMHDYVLANGKYYSTYLHISTALVCAFYIIGITGAALAFKKRPVSVVPFLSLFGLFVFLAFWESGARLSLNFFPILLLSVVVAVTNFGVPGAARPTKE